MFEHEICSEWAIDGIKELVRVGPETDRFEFTIQYPAGKVAIRNEVYSLMDDGSFIKPEGNNATSFDTEALAWRVWLNAFESEVKKQRTIYGDGLCFSWRNKPMLAECGCGKTFRVWGYGAFYDGMQRTWIYSSNDEGGTMSLL